VTDGVNGFLVPPDDPRSFAIAVLNIFDDPERAALMGSAGLQTSRSHSDPATFSAHEKLYTSAIADFRRTTDQPPAEPNHRIWSRFTSRGE
jgi:glycosyltransferase involved in cell wall biosynthesis